ncbi:MAG: metalloregulator ArsR/SmtB family transcription factor [bacterium]|nr:metalloregulator ArsR/SmtB family transcription factor [bacterium]
MKKYVKILSALADDTRLSIILILASGERCVCEIEDILKIEQSRVSHALTILKNADIIDFKKEGKWRIYFISTSFKKLKIFPAITKDIQLNKTIKKRLEVLSKISRKEMCK